MGVLGRFERRLEGLVNGAFAKVFRSEVQPVEIAGTLQRECDNRAAIVGAGRTLVPNDFRVELAPRDYDRLTMYAATLSEELAGMVREHAQENAYSFVGPVTVRLTPADELDTGIFRVSSAALAGASTNRREADREHHPAAQTRLEGRGATYLLSRPVNVLGRGADTDVRIDDPGISRRHAEVRLHADGRASVRDLGSTNGTFVDGQTVRETELHDGDTLRVGNTALVYRRGED